MKVFSQWLSEREEVCNEMFDNPSGGDTFFTATKNSINNVRIEFNSYGKGMLYKMVRRKPEYRVGGKEDDGNELMLDRGLVDKMGNDLLGAINKVGEDYRVDLSAVREELNSFKDVTRLMDSILKRFATRTGRKLSPDGNNLYGLIDRQNIKSRQDLFNYPY